MAAFQREVAGRPVDVERHDLEAGAGGAGELVDGGATGGEIRRPSAPSPRRGRPRRPAPVTPCEPAKTMTATRSSVGIVAALPAGEPGDQRLEPAEAALRLGQHVLARARRRAPRCRCRRQGAGRRCAARRGKQSSWEHLRVRVESEEEGGGGEQHDDLADLLQGADRVAGLAADLAQADARATRRARGRAGRRTPAAPAGRAPGARAGRCCRRPASRFAPTRAGAGRQAVGARRAAAGASAPASARARRSGRRRGRPGHAAGSARSASAVQRIRIDRPSAQAPKAPMRLSRMISSLRSRVVPPPKPSATSDRPSSCRQPVASIVAASASAAAERRRQPAKRGRGIDDGADQRDDQPDDGRRPDRLGQRAVAQRQRAASAAA